MAHNSMRAFAEKVYFESGSWKCEKSPSGAHHWFIIHFQMTCRYCGLSKQVPNPNKELTRPPVN